MEKRIILIFNSILLIPIISFGQNDTILLSDSVNIATLIIDFDTHQFEGGNLSYYTCSECNNDSLPFEVLFDDPNDVGGIVYRIIPALDTIFDASIIWMGNGQIFYPVDFSTNHPFDSGYSIVNKPQDISYWGIWGNIYNDTAFIGLADSSWAIIESLKITNLFAQDNYKAGIYLYAPAVGLFDPYLAKWIIFLYSKRNTNSIVKLPGKKRDQIIYPNPAKNVIEINQHLLNEKVGFYKILDQTGAIVDEGIIGNEHYIINLSLLTNGFYILELFDYENRIINTTKFIKQ